MSVNDLILKMIDRGLGIALPAEKMIFHDLDYLAGTWNDKDKKEFDENVQHFQSIEECL